MLVWQFRAGHRRAGTTHVFRKIVHDTFLTAVATATVIGMPVLITEAILRVELYAQDERLCATYVARRLESCA